MEGINNEIMEEVSRANPFCVISKQTFGKYAVHDIQTNSAWSANPYGDAYATVSDELMQGIRETRGFCDIVLNEDGTEVVSFTAREIPDLSDPNEATNKQIADLKAQLDATDYQAIKYAEGWMTDAEYAPVKAQRQVWRDQINELEAQLL